jgi:hypothetical protein
MSYGFTIVAESQPDFTARAFVARATVTITTGTYPTGGVGPLGLAALQGLGIQSATPKQSFQDSIANPPSGYVWLYDPATDKIRAFVSGAEITGTVAADTVEVQQWFNRGQ